MDYIASHFLQIGYGVFILAAALLVGAIYIGVDLFFEYRRTMQALSEQAERYKVKD